MRVKERAVVPALGLVILGATVCMVVFAPLGTLGSAERQSYEVDRFSIIGFIAFCLIGGYFVVKTRAVEEEITQGHDAETQNVVWPPTPMKRTGTGSAGAKEVSESLRKQRG